MENRLIYFGMPAEKMENAEASQVDDSESDLKKSAQTLDNLRKLEDLAKKLEGVEAKKNSATQKADTLLADANISEGAKKVLLEKKKACSNQSDAGKLEAAVKDLEAAVDFQTKRLPENLGKQKEFEGFAKIPDAAKIFASITIEGSNLRGLPKPAEFRMLKGKQKDEVLKKVNAIASNIENPEGAKVIEALYKKFISSSDTPDSWKEWLEDLERKKSKNEGETLAYGVTWVNKNIVEMQLSTIRYESFKSANQDKLKTAGVILRGKGEFQKLSRGERNEYLETMRSKVAESDENLAKQIQAAEVSDGAEARGKSTEMHDSAQEAEKARSEKLTKWVGEIQKSPLRKRLLEKVAEKKKEAAKDTSADAADAMANLRKQHASGESHPNVFKKMGNVLFAKFGMKAEEAKGEKEEKDDEVENKAREAAIKEIVGGGEEGKKEVAFDKNDADELKRIFGVDKVEKDEAAKLLQMMAASEKQLNQSDFAQMVKQNKKFFEQKTNLDKAA
jgi:hypothetical protein